MTLQPAPVKFLTMLAAFLLMQIANGSAEDVDFEKLAKPERIKLVGCVSDTLVVVEKHRLPHQLFSLWDFLEAACAIEVDRVKSAAENSLKDDLYKKMVPGQIILGMFENASEIYKERRLAVCTGTGCSLEEYRTCLMKQMPSELQARTSPVLFENRSRQRCTDAESAARIALTNDFGNVQRRHSAGGLTHKMNDVIGGVIDGKRREVVVFYAEDLVKVKPGRKSCRPEMCGSSPCISLSDEPTEYQCVIDQK